MEERSGPPPPDSGEFLQTTGARGDCSLQKFLRRLGASLQPPLGSAGPPGEPPGTRPPPRTLKKRKTPRLGVPRLRPALQTFLPRTQLWHRAAAGRSSLGEEAGRLRRSHSQPRPEPQSGRVPAVAVCARGRGLSRATHAHLWVRAEPR